MNSCFSKINEKLSQKSWRNFIFGLTAIISIILISGIFAAASGGWTEMIGEIIFFIIVGFGFLMSIIFSVWACLRCNSEYEHITD